MQGSPWHLLPGSQLPAQSRVVAAQPGSGCAAPLRRLCNDPDRKSGSRRFERPRPAIRRCNADTGPGANAEYDPDAESFHWITLALIGYPPHNLLDHATLEWCSANPILID